jgi:hypothetical protein
LKRVIDKFKEAEIENNKNNVYIQRMRVMGLREGEGRQSVLKGKTKRVYNQLLTGTVSVATLRCLLERRAEQLWVCPFAMRQNHKPSAYLISGIS